MSNEHKPLDGGELRQPGLSRRRMLRRGVGVAAPAALTLASNPVSACTCVNASVFVSQVAMSSRPPAGVSCNGGDTPSTWYNKHKDYWPSACKYSNGNIKTLYDVFGSDRYNWSGCGFSTSSTLKDAMNCSNYIARDVAAAYVNACRSDYQLILKPDEVRKMWRALAVSGGRYTPTGTTFSWDGAMSQNWLKYMR